MEHRLQILLRGIADALHAELRVHDQPGPCVRLQHRPDGEVRRHALARHGVLVLAEPHDEHGLGINHTITPPNEELQNKETYIIKITGPSIKVTRFLMKYPQNFNDFTIPLSPEDANRPVLKLCGEEWVNEIFTLLLKYYKFEQFKSYEDELRSHSSDKILITGDDDKYNEQIHDHYDYLATHGHPKPFPEREKFDGLIVKKTNITVGFIESCDMLMVYNTDYRLTEEMRKDIKIATLIGKRVEYLKEPIRPLVITLCGSKEFKPEFDKLSLMLRQLYHIVLEPNFDFGPPESAEEIEYFHQVHNAKMDMSDVVIFINKDNYMGHDTMRELEYCKLRNIPIRYFTEVEALMGSLESLQSTLPRRKRQ